MFGNMQASIRLILSKKNNGEDKRMKKMAFVIMLVVFLVVPVASIASNVPEDCSENPAEIFLAALGDKMCCFEKGKVIGRCHELTPYYNVLNGECYATRDDCKQSAGGYDFCFKCTTPCK